MKARAIAFYLPQYHPVPENDAFWGKGFTEWTNVTKAKPLFEGHQQPNLPSDLGFYDLRVPEVREEQAQHAREAGIEGFCYWHYWFGDGKRVLERIFSEVLDSGEPDFPFCLGWANESWTGKWHGLENEIIFQQSYPGKDDALRHFHSVLPAFQDQRYIKVHGKPLFLIYRPELLPDCHEFTRFWNSLAISHGLSGIHFVSNGSSAGDWCRSMGIDAFALNNLSMLIDHLHQDRPYPIHSLLSIQGWKQRINRLRFGEQFLQFHQPHCAAYSAYVDEALRHPLEAIEYPVIYPNWDSTPRLREMGYVLLESSPEHFAKLLDATIARIADRDPEERIVFIKSWNEWAEGNTLEPSRQHGRRYIDTCSSLLR